MQKKVYPDRIHKRCEQHRMQRESLDNGGKTKKKKEAPMGVPWVQLS